LEEYQDILLGATKEITKIGKRQTLLFSARCSPSVEEFAPTLLSQDFALLLNPVPFRRIDFNFFQVSTDSEKENRLLNWINSVDDLTIVFANTSTKVDFLEGLLVGQGYSVGTIHGSKTQKEVTEALRNFNLEGAPILICETWYAGAHNIPNARHVIHYDISEKMASSFAMAKGTEGRPAAVSTFIIMEKDKKNIPDLFLLVQQNDQDAPDWLADACSDYIRNAITKRPKCIH
jgi:ATP-dependent RNA helicase RhlE